MNRTVAANVVLRVSGAGLGFLTSLVIARLLGVAGFGIYVFVMAWVALLAIPVGYGTPQWLLREAAQYRSYGVGDVAGLLKWASIRVALASLIVVTISAGLILWLSPWKLPITWAFVTALCLLPLNAFTDIQVSTIHGLNRVVLSQLPRLTIQPLLFLGFLGLASGTGLTPAGVFGLNAAASLAALVVAATLTARLVIPAAKGDSRVAARTPNRTGLYSFMLISAMHLINNRADVLMLGSIDGPAAAGAYSAAARMAELVAFFLVAVNAAIAPLIGSAWGRGDRAGLQFILTRAARKATAGALAIAGFVIVFRTPLLGLFGDGFSVASNATIVLAIAQVLNAASGSVALLLNMSGYERKTFVGVSLAAIVNIGMNAWLIPVLGLDGAAIATATSLITWNVLLAVWVYRNLRLDPTVLGLAPSDRR